MTYKIEKLVLLPERKLLADEARHSKVGRAWLAVASPKRNRVVAERIALMARVDDGNALIRIRPAR